MQEGLKNYCDHDDLLYSLNACFPETEGGKLTLWFSGVEYTLEKVNFYNCGLVFMLTKGHSTTKLREVGRKIGDSPEDEIEMRPPPTVFLDPQTLELMTDQNPDNVIPEEDVYMVLMQMVGKHS
jgi:hypothetical protein